MTPKRIFLVDDDLLGSSLNRDVLKEAGYEVTALVSGERALTLLEAGPAPDLVVMDLDLGAGRMDGGEAARRILEKADLPIVFLSAHTDPETIARSRAVAKYGFVHKIPGNEAFLLATVETALQIHDLETRRRRDAEVLRSFVEAMPEPAFLMKADGALLMANSAFLTRFGRTAEEAIGQDVFAWLPPDAAARRRARFDEAVASASTVTYEDERAGRRLRNILYPILDAAGRVDRVAVISLDVTEASLREEALRRSERLYRTLAEILPESVLLAGGDGAVRLANRMAAEIHGFAAPEEMLGTSIFDLIAPSARPGTDEAFRAGLAGAGIVRRQATRLRRRGDGEFAAEVSAVLLPDEKDGAPSILAVARDVEAERRAEAELRKSREELVEAQRLGAMGHWEFVPATGRVEWSAEVYRMFGLDPAAGIDRDRFLGAIHPEDRPGFEAGIGEGRDRSADFRIVRPDGEVRYLHEATRVVLDESGRPERIHGICQDITERRLIELSLRESERRLTTLMTNVPGLVFRCRREPGCPMEFLSDGCRDLTGFEPRDLLAGSGTPLSDLIEADDRARVESDLEAGWQSGRSFRIVFRLRTKDGDRRWVALRGRAVPGPEGAPAAMEGILLDIGEQRRAEEIAEKSLQEKSVLLKELQHRVKNNLAVISSLLNLEAERLHDPRDRDIFRMMRNRIRSMALIYERLYKSDDFRTVDSKAYLEGLARQLFESNQIRPGQVRLSLRFESFPIELRKAASCGLIFTELISNSLKHAFPGGRRGHLEVAAVRKGEGFVLSVRDDGTGFDAESAEKDAEGFGLKLVRGQVDQIDGVLKIESIPGTVIEVEVPTV